MDTETRAAFAALDEKLGVLTQAVGANGKLDGLDVKVSALAERVDEGFARVDHFFELQQAQHLELRERLDALSARVDALTVRVDALAVQVNALTEQVNALTEQVNALTEQGSRIEHGSIQFRDYVTREIAEIRAELRDLRARSDQTDETRRAIAELTVRIDRLERRQD